MEIIPLEIPDILLIKPVVFGDERGFFKETFRKELLLEHGVDLDFVQDNYSRSRKGTLRGLHYQLEHSQDKLVLVGRGKVLDVAVDVRVGSPTYGKSVSVELSDENHNMLFIPKGFAHGFCVMSDEADFLYKCSDYYYPKGERGIYWNDPDLNIEWPELESDYILSPKDEYHPLLKEMDSGDLPVWKP